jgi:hypothetical protein
MAVPEALRPRHLVWNLIAGGVINAVRSLGQKALQDQNSEVIRQGDEELYRIHVQRVSKSEKPGETIPNEQVRAAIRNQISLHQRPQKQIDSLPVGEHLRYHSVFTKASNGVG